MILSFPGLYSFFYTLNCVCYNVDWKIIKLEYERKKKCIISESILQRLRDFLLSANDERLID